jgi:hypothetical protein
MAIGKIIKSVIGADRADAIDQGAKEERRVRKDAKMIDVAHEALASEAKRRSDELNGLIKMGWPLVKQEKLKGKVRKKVWDIVSEETGIQDQEMVEEITERIVEVSEADEYYKKMFDKDDV